MHGIKRFLVKSAEIYLQPINWMRNELSERANEQKRGI